MVVVALVMVAMLLRFLPCWRFGFGLWFQFRVPVRGVLPAVGILAAVVAQVANQLVAVDAVLFGLAQRHQIAGDQFKVWSFVERLQVMHFHGLGAAAADATRVLPQMFRADGSPAAAALVLRLGFALDDVGNAFKHLGFSSGRWTTSSR